MIFDRPPRFAESTFAYAEPRGESILSRRRTDRPSNRRTDTARRGATHRRGGQGGGGRPGSRRRRRPHIRVLASVATVGAFALGGLLVTEQDSAESRTMATPQDPDELRASEEAVFVPPSPSPSVSESPSPSPSPSPSTQEPDEPDESAEQSVIPVPATGPGTFTTAQASGEAVGQGTIRTYQVQVEDGIELSARQAAREVAAILAHPRGWTNDGVNGFRLVASGPADFIVKIATPGTADAICGAAGLNTRGELNCAVGPTVVVNLKRWVLGSPQFAGPVTEYRALIVNHEVGHRIGRGHETCPGPGRPAPAMMQQIKGLKGCVANAWPYDADGTYLGGPSVP
ncbi:Protein of unknown function [Streptomyces radiopugnans]|uniref:DUF3152 domain-containing protein n=1 Tax=Streptomyces radiopugnans TaxID=403935 RepID=A0A1H9EDC4_9ACTN|nr:Protein of unknown function [Streptomyces radiopugnans]